MQSEVLDEFAFEPIILPFEECKAPWHWQLLPIRPLPIYLTHIFRVCLTDFLAQSDNTPRIQICVISISDHYSKVANLCAYDILCVKTWRRFCCLSLCRIRLICNLRSILILFGLFFEKVFFADAHQHDSRWCEIFVGQSIWKHSLHEFFLMVFNKIRNKRLIFKAAFDFIMIWKNDDRIELLPCKLMLHLSVILMQNEFSFIFFRDCDLWTVIQNGALQLLRNWVVEYLRYLPRFAQIF